MTPGWICLTYAHDKWYPIPFIVLSRLPPKLVPLLVRAAFGGRRRRSSSHHRSTFHFPFVLSSHTPGFNTIITCCVFNPLFPPCPCPELFIVSVCARYSGVRRVLYLLYWLFCLRWFLYCTVVTVFALLRLTSLPPVRTPYSALPFTSVWALVKSSSMYRE